MFIVKERIEWIDVAKGVGLLCVILGHLKTPYLTFWIYTFHMPLFFFLSGVVFSGDKYSFKEFLKRKIYSLVIPYFVLGSIIFVFLSFYYHCLSCEYNSIFDDINMLKSFLIQKHFWTVWFLACLFIVEIVYYIINKINKSLIVSSILSFIILIIGLCLKKIFEDGLPWNIDVAFVAQIYFHLGYIFKKEQIFDKLKNFKRLNYLLLCLIFLFVNVFTSVLSSKVTGKTMDMSIGMYGFFPLTFISSISGILFIIMCSNKFGIKPLIYLGQNTMVIFSLHSRVVIVLCQFFYLQLGIFQSENYYSRIGYSIVSLIIILGTLVPLTELLKNSKFHFLFGL